MTLKFYGYQKCSSCQSALKYLKSKNIQFTEIDIISSPPSRQEIQEMLIHLEKKGQGINKLFNVSGEVYRELKLKDKIPSMSEAELIKLLLSNGKLIKRPFLIGEFNQVNLGIVGFKQEEWDKLF